MRLCIRGDRTSLGCLSGRQYVQPRKVLQCKYRTVFSVQILVLTILAGTAWFAFLRTERLASCYFVAGIANVSGALQSTAVEHVPSRACQMTMGANLGSQALNS